MTNETAAPARWLRCASASRTRFAATGRFRSRATWNCVCTSRSLATIRAPREQFGKAGDFYTSSDVHAVFGRLLARQFEEMWRALDSPARIDLIELGPGTRPVCARRAGLVSEAVSRVLRALRYALVEQSAHLRERLQERLSEHIAAGRAQVFESLEAAASQAGETRRLFSATSSSMRCRSKWWTIAARCASESRTGGLWKPSCRRRPAERSFSIATAFIRKRASASKRRWRRWSGWSASPGVPRQARLCGVD